MISLFDKVSSLCFSYLFRNAFNYEGIYQPTNLLPEPSVTRADVKAKTNF
jgi:hypothetical protein